MALLLDSDYIEAEGQMERASQRFKDEKDLDSAGEMGYNYTEEQYNSFGWARHAKAITKNELDDLDSKLQEKGSLRRFKQSARGEAIVEVNDKPHTTLGVDNVFAFVKGSVTDPQITRMLRVSLFSETDMEKVRKFIYDNEKRTHARTSVAVGNFFFEKGLFAEFTRQDFGSYQEYRAEIGKRGVRSQSEGNQAYDRSRYERERYIRRSEDDVVYSIPLDTEGLTEAEVKQAEELQREIPTKKRGKSAKERTEAKLKQYFSTEGAYEMLHSVYGLKDLSPKSIQAMSNQIWQALNASVSAGEKALIAWNTAGFILDRMMTTDLIVKPVKMLLLTNRLLFGIIR